MTNEERDREHQETPTPVVDPNPMSIPEMSAHIDESSNAQENSNTRRDEGITINQDFSALSIGERRRIRDDVHTTLTISQREALERSIDDDETTVDINRKAPPKDHKMRDNEPIFEQGDIIEYMFKNWYLKPLDWAANKALNTVELGLVALFDKPEKPDPAFSENVGNSDHAAFVTDLDTYVNKRQKAVANRISASEAERKDAIKAFKMSTENADDKDRRSEAITALGLSGEFAQELAELPSNISDEDLNKKIYEIYRNDKVTKYVTALSQKDADPSLVPQEYMSEEAVKAFQRQLFKNDSLSFDDKRSIFLSIARAEMTCEIGKLKATAAKMADKHRNGSSKYNNLDFNDKDAVAAMFMEEGKEYHEAMKREVDDNALDYLLPGDQPDKMAEFANIANDAFDREQNLSKGNKGWFDRGGNKALKKLHKDLKLKFNIKKQAKDDNTTLIEGDDGLYKGYKEKNLVLQGMKKLGLRRAKAKRMRDLIDGKNQEIIINREGNEM